MTTNLKFDIDPTMVAAEVRRIRASLSHLSLMERLETFGACALMEAIDHGFADSDIKLMFESMRDRFMRGALQFHCARQLLAVLREKMQS